MPRQPSPTDYRDFVRHNESELKNAATSLSGHTRFATLLLRKALANTAKNWRRERANDPLRYSLDRIEKESLRYQGDHDDGVHAVDDLDTLVADTWADGKKLRRGRRNIRFGVISIVLVLVGVYVWTTGIERPEPVPGALDSDSMHSLDNGYLLLPPPDILAKTPVGSSSLHTLGDPMLLTDSPLPRFAAVTNTADGVVTAIGENGEQRTLSTVYDNKALGSRSIAHNGDKFVLVAGASLHIVATDGSTTIVEGPLTHDVPIDAGWSGDDLSLLVTYVDATYLIEIATGDATKLGFIGTNTDTRRGSDQIREITGITDQGATIHIWGGDPVKRDFMIENTDLPASEWTGPPFMDDYGSQIARACIPDVRATVPREYGTPIECIAVIDVSGKIEDFLIITDAHLRSGHQLIVDFRSHELRFVIASADGMQQTLYEWDLSNHRIHKIATIAATTTIALLRIN